MSGKLLDCRRYISATVELLASEKASPKDQTPEAEDRRTWLRSFLTVEQSRLMAEAGKLLATEKMSERPSA